MSRSDSQRNAADTIVNAADDDDLVGWKAGDAAGSLEVQSVAEEGDASNGILERGGETADRLRDDGGALAVR